MEDGPPRERGLAGFSDNRKGETTTMPNEQLAPSTMDLRIPGFEILQLIGKGGMGEVHLARQLTLNRFVAIKLLKLDQDGDREYQIERFRREAELMARAGHPNIVSVFDFGVADGRPYLVMERIEGGDLRKRLTCRKAMRTEQVREIVRPVGRALAYLHRLGILHRDLKPENVLLHNEDNPKVTDFGIAVLHTETNGRLTRTGSAGTIGYVAPEQHYGLAVDHRADEFSLAAMTYEMLTGHMPLGVVRPPSTHNRRLSPAVDRVLLKALRKIGTIDSRRSSSFPMRSTRRSISRKGFCRSRVNGGSRRQVWR